ncbi:MAG: nitrogen fixation protein NifQ [Pseudomonadota bacterium]
MNAQLALLPDVNAAQNSNHEWLSLILLAQRNGEGCLPYNLGLDFSGYTQLLQRLAVPFQTEQCAVEITAANQALEKGALRQQLLEMRRDEWQEIRALLLNGRRNADIAEIWLADIVAAGCLGGNHLWRDLGLPSRAALRDMLLHNFPVVALRNDRDMRWKKFFYKQLCEQQGGYVCRSPSCDQCPTYQDCFGDEQ